MTHHLTMDLTTSMDLTLTTTFKNHILTTIFMTLISDLFLTETIQIIRRRTVWAQVVLACQESQLSSSNTGYQPYQF